MHSASNETQSSVCVRGAVLIKLLSVENSTHGV